MNPHTAQQQRQPGGRFGPKQAAAASTPADVRPVHAVLDRLARQRARNGGLLLPHPLPPERMRAARLVVIEDQAGRRSEPSDDLLAIEHWLRTIAKAGASAKDLERAWSSWQATLPYGKRHLRPTFDELHRQARARDVRRDQQADKEDRPAIRLHGLRCRALQVRGLLKPLEEEAEKLRKELSELEAAEAEELQRHPWLEEWHPRGSE